MDSWNDERLDELSRRMDAGFEQTAAKVELNAVKVELNAVKAEMNQRFDVVGRRLDESAARSDRFESQVATEFHRLVDRLDKLFYIQLFFLVSLAAALITDQA